MDSHFLILQIGIVHSNYTDPKDINQHKLYETTGISKIEIFSEYQKGLKDLGKYYNAILVLYWMHKLSSNERSKLTFIPLNDNNYPETGIFASASPPRPNPIGVTPCEIIRINKNVLEVRGLDALNGSPVIDIKPYSSYNYTIFNPKMPKWIIQHHQGENLYKAKLK